MAENDTFERTLAAMSWMSNTKFADDEDPVRAAAERTEIAAFLAEFQEREGVPDDLRERGVDLLVEWCEDRASTGTSTSDGDRGERSPGRISDWSKWTRRIDEWKERYPDGLEPGAYRIECRREDPDEAREYVESVFEDVDVKADVFAVKVPMSEGRTKGPTEVRFRLREHCDVEPLPERLRIRP